MSLVYHILQSKGAKVISIDCNESVYEALKIMVEYNIGAIIITDGGLFCGVFTERDYARKVMLKGRTSADTPLKDTLDESYMSVSPDTSIEMCMALMADKWIRYLPVFDKGELIGMVSIGDIVKYMIEDHRFTIEQLEHYITDTRY